MNFRWLKHFDFVELDSGYTDQGRYYVTPNGDRYPSVTTVLGQADDSNWLEEWKLRVGEKEAAKISKFSTKRGTAFHDICEKYLRNDPDFKKGKMPIEISNFNDIKHFLDNNIEIVAGCEIPLWSDEYQVAGRTDAIVRWNGKWSVLDFKTSRRNKDDIEGYYVQESVYAMMIKERYDVDIEQIITVMAIDDSPSKMFTENPRIWFPKFVEARKKTKWLMKNGKK